MLAHGIRATLLTGSRQVAKAAVARGWPTNAAFTASIVTTTVPSLAKPEKANKTAVRRAPYRERADFIRNIEALHKNTSIKKLPEANVSDFEPIKKPNGYTMKQLPQTLEEKKVGAVTFRFCFKATNPLTKEVGHAITQHTYSGIKRNGVIDLKTDIPFTGVATPLHTHNESCTTIVLAVDKGFTLEDQVFTASKDPSEKNARHETTLIRTVGSTTCDIVPEREPSTWAHRIVLRPNIVVREV